jgi:hypothetical protein
VVVLLPIVLVVLVVGLLGGGRSSFMVLLPMAFALGAGMFLITMVLRDAKPPRNPGVRQLPTEHLQRHMYKALRPRRPKSQQGKDDTSD